MRVLSRLAIPGCTSASGRRGKLTPSWFDGRLELSIDGGLRLPIRKSLSKKVKDLLAFRQSWPQLDPGARRVSGSKQNSDEAHANLRWLLQFSRLNNRS